MKWLSLHHPNDEAAERDQKSEVFYYTGVGARVTPYSVCVEMAELAKALNDSGYCLRSGAARKGADAAFKLGSGGNNQLFDPKGVNYPISPHAYGIAERHHPYWDNLDPYMKDLMARNVHAVLGPDLLMPSKFLICWTVDGMNCRAQRTRASGGTGHTVSVADEFRVPRYNLNNPDDYKKVMSILKEYDNEQ